MTSLLAAACAGLAAWCSIGALAVIHAGGAMARVGLLPSIWLLPVLIAAAVAVVWLVKPDRETLLPLFASLFLVLPWIPGQVPSAFLIWTGRPVIYAWVAIAAAVIAARASRHSAAPWMRNPRRAPVAAAVVACVLYLGSAWWISNLLPGGDEPHYLIITQSLLKDHDLRIENNHARRDYLEYFRGDLRPDFRRRGTDGQIYSIHAPGLPAVVAPAFALAGYPGVVLFLAIVASIGGALMWLATYRLSGNTGAAWFTWAAWSLTVPFFFQAFSVFPDGLGATLVLIAVFPLLHQGSGAISRLLLAGLALALLPWLHTRFAVIAVALGTCIALRLLSQPEGRKHLAAFLAAPTLSALGWFSFFRIIYGSFNPTGPYKGSTETEFANIFTGLPALFFDQQFGILPYAPVYSIGVVAMIALARRQRRLAIELSATACLYLLSSSAYHMWWGGNSAPARFAVPVLPLLVLPIGWLWTTARPATRALGIALLGASMGFTLTAVMVQHGQLAYNVRDGYSRLAGWLSPVVDFSGALPSFFRQAPGTAVAFGSIWILSMAVVWLIVRSLRSTRWLPAATLGALAAAVMVSTTLVWRLQHVAGATPEYSQLNLLERVDPRIRPMGIDLARCAFMPASAIVSRLQISTPQGAAPPSAHTLLVVPNVLPAGTYSLTVPNPSTASGTARLVIGRNAPAVASWNLGTDLRDGAVRFDLPVSVGSIIVEGDDEAARVVKTLSLRPVQVVNPSDRLAGDFARRAQRYGPGVVYFFDDGQFVEDAGFWVKGGDHSRFAVTRVDPQSSVQMFVRNAAAANRIVIEVDGQPRTLSLESREERMVPVPFTRGSSVLMTVRSAAGFRPSEVDAGSTDTRYLGVWIELR